MMNPTIAMCDYSSPPLWLARMPYTYACKNSLRNDFYMKMLVRKYFLGHHGQWSGMGTNLGITFLSGQMPVEIILLRNNWVWLYARSLRNIKYVCAHASLAYLKQLYSQCYVFSFFLLFAVTLNVSLCNLWRLRVFVIY